MNHSSYKVSYSQHLSNCEFPQLWVCEWGRRYRCLHDLWGVSLKIGPGVGLLRPGLRRLLPRVQWPVRGHSGVQQHLHQVQQLQIRPQQPCRIVGTQSFRKPIQNNPLVSGKSRRYPRRFVSLGFRNQNLDKTLFWILSLEVWFWRDEYSGSWLNDIWERRTVHNWLLSS